MSEMQSAPEGLPRRLGRYELVEALGGGMSEVYRARIADAIGPERPLVVKLAARSVSDDPRASVRFLDEAKLALALSHGNVTTAFELGKEEGRYYIVMEFVRGASVRALVEAAVRGKEPLPIGAALTIGIEVARALQYAHTFVHPELGPMPLVHRDVNPGNVLVARDGQVKLTDFGIAHALGGDPGHGVIWGQARYVAPELFEGAPATAATDLYGLGAVLHHLICLEPPFSGATDAETLEAARKSPGPSLRERLPSLRAEVDDVVASLLARDPARRPASAEEARRALERAQAVVAPGYRIEDLARTVQRLIGPEASPAVGGPGGREKATTDPTVPLAESFPQPPKSILPGPAMPTMPGTRSSSGVGPMLAIAFLLLVVGAVGWLLLRAAPRRETRAPRADPALLAPAPAPAPAPVPVQTAEVRHDPDPGPTPRPHGKRVAARGEPAMVTFNSLPWSIVTVDGRRLPGHTPLRNVALAPGHHSVRFDNPELRMRRTVSVDLAAGERRVVSAMLEPEPTP